jgi:hypothetical protein
MGGCRRRGSALAETRRSGAVLIQRGDHGGLAGWPRRQRKDAFKPWACAPYPSQEELVEGQGGGRPAAATGAAEAMGEGAEFDHQGRPGRRRRGTGFAQYGEGAGPDGREKYRNTRIGRLRHIRF